MRIHPLNDCCFVVEQHNPRYTFYFHRKVKCLDDVAGEGLRVALSSLCFLVEHRMEEITEATRVSYQLHATPVQVGEVVQRLIEYGCWNHVFRNAHLVTVPPLLHAEQACFLYHPATEETAAALTVSTLVGVVENGEVDADITAAHFPCLHHPDAPYAFSHEYYGRWWVHRRGGGEVVANDLLAYLTGLGFRHEPRLCEHLNYRHVCAT